MNEKIQGNKKDSDLIRESYVHLGLSIISIEIIAFIASLFPFYYFEKLTNILLLFWITGDTFQIMQKNIYKEIKLYNLIYIGVAGISLRILLNEKGLITCITSLASLIIFGISSIILHKKNRTYYFLKPFYIIWAWVVTLTWVGLLFFKSIIINHFMMYQINNIIPQIELFLYWFKLLAIPCSILLGINDTLNKIKEVIEKNENDKTSVDIANSFIKIIVSLFCVFYFIFYGALKAKE